MCHSHHLRFFCSFILCVCVCEERICLLVLLVVFVCLKMIVCVAYVHGVIVCLCVGYRHSHSPGLPLRDTVAPWRQYPWLHRRYHFSLNYKYRYWGHLDTHAHTHADSYVPVAQQADRLCCICTF